MDPARVASPRSVLPHGAPVSVFAIFGALLASACCPAARRRPRSLTATVATVLDPVVLLARGERGAAWLDTTTGVVRLVFVLALCAMVGCARRSAAPTCARPTSRSRATCDLHVYAGEFHPDGDYLDELHGPRLEHFLGRPLRPERAQRGRVGGGGAPGRSGRLRRVLLAGRPVRRARRPSSSTGSCTVTARSTGSSTACPSRGRPRGPTRVSGFCIDITERRAEADELRDARARVTRLVETIDDVFFELELTPRRRPRGAPRERGHRASARRAGRPRRAGGLARRRARGRPRAPGATTSRACAPARRARPSTGMVGFDGIERTVWVRVFPHRDHGGGLLLIGVLSDISEQTTAARRARRGPRARRAPGQDRRADRPREPCPARRVPRRPARARRHRRLHGRLVARRRPFQADQRLARPPVGRRGADRARPPADEGRGRARARGPARRRGARGARRAACATRWGCARSPRRCEQSIDAMPMIVEGGVRIPVTRLDRRGAGRRQLPDARLAALGRRPRAVRRQAARPQPGRARRRPDAGGPRGSGARGRQDRAEPGAARRRPRGRAARSTRARSRGSPRRSRASSACRPTPCAAACSAAGCTTSARRASPTASC